ncbi:molybdopterin-binding protein [Planotetraspora thailandica]|uniref:Molybdopterin-binding protein n=1 Tax=Planotetraspora thailandica TaxID=487172 RepID=A0A8J3V955_9ACTN|nr:molybdopterin-dependent oxidoreductase [Planotetraspora thailandica]GII56339.1 molybdopterin-binding protein [Planotetraspora thailandica]
MDDGGPRLPAWVAALIGVISGAVALGVAQLVAGLTNPDASPVIAVGGSMVDRTPAALKEWAIRTFGSNDKLVLISGIVVVLALIAAGLGVLSRRRVGYGMTGLLVFGLIGAAAAMTRPDAGSLDILPSLVGVGAGAWALSLLIRRAEVHPWEPLEDAAAQGTSAWTDDPDAPPGQPARTSGETISVETPPVMRAGDDLYAFDRRRLLTGAVVGLGVAGVTGLGGKLLASSNNVDAARKTLAKTLPRPTIPARPIPAGADLRIKGLSPFVTPNSDFYRVDTALVIPGVDPASWTLKIHGLVDKPIELTFADLLKRPLMEADVTLTCVSNDVGGPYVGNARWLGARLADLLREAGIKPGADMLLSTSKDGFTAGTPVDVVMDGRDALLAIAMNGEVLPTAHGFPVRQVVPGLYGYVSATKWITDLKVTRFDQDEAYWTPRGWSPKGPIKTESRIDVPKDGDDIPAGRTTIAGVAWAQHKGIAAVEVQVDGGEWREATLAQVPGPDTWRQWSIVADLAKGKHVITVRATDVTGYTQTLQYAPPAPDGATGYHSIGVKAG